MALHARSIEIPHPVFLHQDVPDGHECLRKGLDGSVWVKVQVEPPQMFADLREGGGVVVQQSLKRLAATTAKAIQDTGAAHPFNYRQAHTPDGATICAFFNYGECKFNGTTCPWDHSHCHRCKLTGHKAKDCISTDDGSTNNLVS